jgi:cytochrome c553
MRRVARWACSALILLAAAVAGAAPAGDDPVAGRALYDDTPGASGIPSLTGSCNNCHSVQTRRRAVSGTPDDFADVTFDAAMTRFAQAAQNVPPMNQFQQLDLQQARDIAAYIADTPKTTPTHNSQLDFTTNAINTMSAAQTVELRHAVATNENLSVLSVEIAGTGAAKFQRTMLCDGAVLTPGQACTLSLTFAPQDSTSATPELRFTLRQGGSSATFTRVLRLSGSVTASNPPPAPPAPADTGGGSLQWSWLLGLAIAIGLLWRRRP